MWVIHQCNLNLVSFNPRWGRNTQAENCSESKNVTFRSNLKYHPHSCILLKSKVTWIVVKVKHSFASSAQKTHSVPEEGIVQNPRRSRSETHPSGQNNLSKYQWVSSEAQQGGAGEAPRRGVRSGWDEIWRRHATAEGGAEKACEEEPRESQVLWLCQWRWQGPVLSEGEREVCQTQEYYLVSSHGCWEHRHNNTLWKHVTFLPWFDQRGLWVKFPLEEWASKLQDLMYKM